MTSVRAVMSTAKRRAGWMVRDRFPRRPVVRDVQGVRMVLPWSHRLPDYAAHGPLYGQNLVQLARLLAESSPPLTVLDVGANVGDSALQILHATDGAVLCVEGDPFYLDYLHRNVDADARVTVTESLIAVGDLDEARAPVREGGTTRFIREGTGDAMPTLTPAQLRAEFPDFADLRLVKSDTDGYDVALVPAIAEAWQESRPVLFFEYDPHLTRLAGLDPYGVWRRLKALGYTDVAVWDNGGTVLGRSSVSGVEEHARVLGEAPAPRRGRARGFWDVAVAHGEDTTGREMLDRLVPASRVL